MQACVTISPYFCRRSLDPSPGFSVQAATINAHTAFDRHAPRTLEDKFTLLHQHLLCILSYILRGLIPEKGLQALPSSPLFQTIIQKLEQKHTLGDFTAHLDSLRLTPSGLAYSYNIPLRNHNSRVTPEGQKMDLLCCMYACWGKLEADGTP